jgi:hypothetical protein
MGLRHKIVRVQWDFLQSQLKISFHFVNVKLIKTYHELSQSYQLFVPVITALNFKVRITEMWAQNIFVDTKPKNFFDAGFEKWMVWFLNTLQKVGQISDSK